MRQARLRLASLWLSQAARVMADNGLRMLVVLALVRAGDGSAWRLATAVLMVPAIVLAPLNGALINSLPKPLLLSASAAFSLLAGLLFLVPGDIGLACWGLIAVGMAVYRPTRDAFYPAAARATRIPLAGVNGWMEMGAMLAVVGGLLLGMSFDAGKVNPGWLLAAGLGLVALLAALPVHFAGDLRRSEGVGAALVGFFRDARRVLQISEARGCLIGLASLRALITGLTLVLAGGISAESFNLDELLRVAVWVVIGLAIGSWLAGLNRHPRRVLGLVVLGAAGLTLGMLVASLGVAPAPVFCVLLGIMGGLVNVPLAASYQVAVPADARGNAMAIRYATDYLGVLVITGALYGLAKAQILDGDGQLWLLTGLTLVLAVLSGWWLIRELLELFVEFGLWAVYRIRDHGPGVHELPPSGPLIVLANHCSYLDPMWVAKVIPRRLIPMMTSVFFDLPVVRWLMTNVAHTIRVQASGFRREVPEIKEAIAMLDRGEALMVFPEGGLRRKEEPVLRMFGQGIWLILRERPTTPVVVCWVEGGWGSYFSYRNGLPMKNKRFDFCRHVDIGVSAPLVLDPALLENQRATRLFLMQACLEARQHMGLAALSLDKSADADNDEGTRG